jgi:hypothetical protein
MFQCIVHYGSGRPSAHRLGRSHPAGGGDSRRAKAGIFDGNGPRLDGAPQEVASVSQVTRPHSHLLEVTLNNDGKTHPVENTLAVITLLFGLAAFALGFVVAQHFAAVILGLIAIFIGFYDQLISATTPERMLIVTGLIGAFVGVGLGFAHGGFGV